MTKAEELFHKIASELPDVKEGKMFGALCTKTPNGKAGTMFWKEYMIFKLPPDEEKEALQLKGAKLFDPMDGRPMKSWVQLSYDHASKWKKLAEKATEYVRQIKK
jgi:hypothetical protein